MLRLHDLQLQHAGQGSGEHIAATGRGGGRLRVDDENGAHNPKPKRDEFVSVGRGCRIVRDAKRQVGCPVTSEADAARDRLRCAARADEAGGRTRSGCVVPLTTGFR
ncbi:hypothetical protein GCM10027597_34110 [Saccharopolyspora tripterygii]